MTITRSPYLISKNKQTTGMKVFNYHRKHFLRNFCCLLYNCRRLLCLFTNSRHVLHEKDVEKYKCMGSPPGSYKAQKRIRVEFEKLNVINEKSLRYLTSRTF